MGRVAKSLNMQPTTRSNIEKCRSNKQFDKRMKTLEKAAKDLSTLCGVDVAMIVYAPSDQPLISTSIWPPSDNQQQVLAGLIHSYRDTSRNKKAYNLSDFFNDKTDKIEDEIKKLQSDGGLLLAKIDHVRRRIDDLKKGSNRLLQESSSDHTALKDFYSNYPVDDQERLGVFGLPSILWNSEEPGVFGPSMLNYEELPAQYHTDTDQLMTMMGYGVSNGMYEFEENILPGDIETWTGSFDTVPIDDEQMPLDMECCFSSSINAAGGGSEDHQMLSAKEWFLNEESFFLQ